MTDAPRVRRARDDDVPAVAPLIYLPSERMYQRIGAGPERALRIVEDYLRRGALRSVWVAELDGEPAGAMLAYPWEENAARERQFLRSLLRRTPPWRWPAIALMHRHGHRIGQRHTPEALYVDALATVPERRRRGIALALLEHAAHVAAEHGLSAVSLDTAATNLPALALYERAGFDVVRRIPGRPPMPDIVLLRRPVRS